MAGSGSERQQRRPPPRPGAPGGGGAAAASARGAASSRRRSAVNVRGGGGSGSARGAGGSGSARGAGRVKRPASLGEQEVGAMLARAKSEAASERRAVALGRSKAHSPEEVYPPPMQPTGATPPDQPRPLTAPPRSRRRSVSESSVGTAPSSVSGRGYRRGVDVQSMGAKAESISSLPWVGTCRALSNVYLSSFLRVRDEQGRFLLCRSRSGSPMLEPAGVSAFPSSRVASVMNEVERVATERGVKSPGQSELFSRLQGTEHGTVGKVVLPVSLRSVTWDDLRAIDPLFEACRIPRKPRQTGHEYLDSAAARALLMEELVTNLHVLSAAELGRGMATVQREGFACALLPAVGYGLTAEHDTFDVWIGRVCEVTLSDRCVGQLTEHHGNEIYFATPGEIARRRSDGRSKSKHGRWRISRGSALLLQRPEVNDSVTLSTMLSQFCQSDLAARVAQPEVYAKDWYVKPFSGRASDPLLTVREYDPEPEPGGGSQPAKHRASGQPSRTARASAASAASFADHSDALSAQSGRSELASDSQALSTANHGGGVPHNRAVGESDARVSDDQREPLPHVTARSSSVGVAAQDSSQNVTKHRRRPSPPQGPPPASGWTEGWQSANGNGVADDQTAVPQLWGGVHGTQLGGVSSAHQANQAELLRETNERIFRSAAESEAARISATEAVIQAEAKTAAAEAEAQRHARTVQRLERELHGRGWQDSEQQHVARGTLSSRDAEIARIRGRVHDMVQADKQLSQRLSTEFQRQRSAASQMELEIANLQAKIQQLEEENSQLRNGSDAPSDAGSAHAEEMQRREEEFRRELDATKSKYAQANRKLQGRTLAEQVVAKFHAQILGEISRRGEEGQAVDIVAIFESFDTDGDGILSHKELLVGLREFGIKMTKQESKELLAVLDGDADGIVDWHEFAHVIQHAQEDAQKRFEEQMEGTNKAQVIEHLKEKLALVENEGATKGAELEELRKLVDKKNQDIVGLEKRLVEAGEMHESERAKLESAREAEAEHSAEQQKASEEAARMAEVHAKERQRLAEEYEKVQAQMYERAQATAKRFITTMTNRVLSDAFAKLRSHVQMRINLNHKWADFVTYLHSKLAVKFRKEIAKKRREQVHEMNKRYAIESERAKQLAAELRQKQMLSEEKEHGDELRYEQLANKCERVEAELKAMQDKYGTLETVQSRRLNSTKAAEAVVAQFSKQIMDVIARRQESDDTVDLQAIFESFDTDGDGSLDKKELVVGLNEFGIKMSMDERKQLLQVLDDDGDGTIEWREFSAVVQRVQQDVEHELEVRKLQNEKNLIANQLAELASDTAGSAGQLESRKMNSSKAARAVCARFNDQIMRIVKDRQSSGDTIDMKSIFETFDTDGNGVVSRRELKVGLVEFGITMKKDEAKELLQILDENGDDEIDWQEFAAVIKQAMEEALEKLEKEGIKTELVDLRGKLAQAKKEAAALKAELQAVRNDGQPLRERSGQKTRSQQLLDIDDTIDSEEGDSEQELSYESDADGDEVPNPSSSRLAKKLLKQTQQKQQKDEKARKAQEQQKVEERARKKEEEDQDAKMKAILSIGFDKPPDGSASMEPSLLCELAENGLERLQPALIQLGYLFPFDLAEALENEGEIDTLAEDLRLKDPEKRRLIKAIPDAMKRAEQEEQRQEQRRRKEKERETAKARENEARMAEERQSNDEPNDADDESVEAGMTVDIQSARFKRLALLNEMKKMKLERLHDVVTNAGYLFPSDLQEADSEERETLLELLNLKPPEHRRWNKLVGGEWVVRTIQKQKVQVEIDPNTLTFAQVLERQGLEKLEEQLGARGYHDIADFQMEDEDAQEAELQDLMKALGLKPPEMRRLRKVLEQEEAPDITLKQALEEISLGRLHAPLVAKGYASPADLVEAEEQELAMVIKNAKLSAPELRRWLQMLEDQGRDDATQTPLPGLRGPEAPDTLLAQAFAAHRMESYQGKLHSIGYQSAVDLQALMEEAENFNEEELASVVKALELKPPEVRRLQAMSEVLEDLAEAEADANGYPEDEEERAVVPLESALNTHNLTRLGPPLRDEGYETVGDLLQADEEELESVIMRRRLNVPEFRRWQRLLGKEEDEDPTNYSPPRTFRKALALQQLDHLAEPLAQQGYLALGDLVAAVDNPGELASLHRILGLKPPEQRRLQTVIDEAEDDDDAEPIEVEEDEALDSALQRLGLERLAQKLSDEGYANVGDVRAAGPEDLDYAQELKSLVEGFGLSPPEWRRWQLIANPDDPQDPPLMLGQALAMQNLVQHAAELGKMGYHSVADLAGVESVELETIVAKLALRPPERRRLETIIAEADGYDDMEDGRPDDELPLQQTLSAHNLGHLCEAITVLGYFSVSDLTDAPEDEIAALLRSLNLQPPEARRLRKAIRREEPDPPEPSDSALARTLRQANAGLEHVAQPLAERGFLSVADLLEADATELSDALQQLQLRAPEHRRLRRLLDAAVKGELLEQNEAPTSQMPDSAEALVAALQRQNLDRLAQPLADHGYHGTQDLVDADPSEWSELVERLSLQPAEERRFKKAIGTGKPH